MFGVMYAIAKLFGFVKDAVMDDITDTQDKRDRQVDSVAYIGKNGLQSYKTGHTLSYVNNHTYKDNITLRTIKVPLSEMDLQKEQLNKKRAIEKGYTVYRCSDYYLPDNVIGIVYKNIDNDRLYVLRQISTFIGNHSKHKIRGQYLISIMPDHFGYVELSFGGKELSMKEQELKDHFFRLDYEFWNDEEYTWRC